MYIKIQFYKQLKLLALAILIVGAYCIPRFFLSIYEVIEWKIADHLKILYLSRILEDILRRKIR